MPAMDRPINRPIAVKNRPKENCVDKTGPDWDYAASPNLATMPDGKTVIIASPKQAVVRALDPERDMTTVCLTTGFLEEANSAMRFQRLSDAAIAAFAR